MNIRRVRRSADIGLGLWPRSDKSHGMLTFLPRALRLQE